MKGQAHESLDSCGGFCSLEIGISNTPMLYTIKYAEKYGFIGGAFLSYKTLSVQLLHPQHFSYVLFHFSSLGWWLFGLRCFSFCM